MFVEPINEFIRLVTINNKPPCQKQKECFNLLPNNGIDETSGFPVCNTCEMYVEKRDALHHPCQECFDTGHRHGEKKDNFSYRYKNRSVEDYCECEKGEEALIEENSFWYKLITPIENKFWEIYHKVKDFPYDVKAFIQRGRRGWADRDTWAFDAYISKVIEGATKRLAKEVHGVPVQVCEEVHGKKWYEEECNDTSDKAFNKWKEILGDISKGFGDAHKISNGEVDDGEGIRMLAEKELKEYRKNVNKAIGLFHKYFFNLGD